MNRIPLILAFILMISLSVPVCGQIEVGKNALSIEFYGISQRLSINYERVLYVKSHSFISGRIGGGIDGLGLPNIPHGVTYCVGKSKSFLEAGILGSLGPTSMGYADTGGSFYVFAPMAGYRRHPERGILFQAYVSPLIPVSGNLGIELIFGLGFGYVFGPED